MKTQIQGEFRERFVWPESNSSGKNKPSGHAAVAQWISSQGAAKSGMQWQGIGTLNQLSNTRRNFIFFTFSVGKSWSAFMLFWQKLPVVQAAHCFAKIFSTCLLKHLTQPVIVSKIRTCSYLLFWHKRLSKPPMWYIWERVVKIQWITKGRLGQQGELGEKLFLPCIFCTYQAY